MQNRKAYALHIDKLLADNAADTTNESNNALKCACQCTTSRGGSEEGREANGVGGEGAQKYAAYRKCIESGSSKKDETATGEETGEEGGVAGTREGAGAAGEV